MHREKANTHVVQAPRADPGAAGERRRDAGREASAVARAGGQQPVAGGEDRPGCGQPEGEVQGHGASSGWEG